MGREKNTKAGSVANTLPSTFISYTYPVWWLCIGGFVEHPPLNQNSLEMDISPLVSPLQLPDTCKGNKPNT